MKAFILCLVIAFTYSCSEATVGGTETGNPPKIKNTASFITYFNGIENMLSFKKVKDSIQNDATNAKRSTTISESNKAILKAYYNEVQQKSEAMYSQIVSDLLNKEKRKEIKSNVEGYIQNINVQFDAIKTSGKAFTDKYNEINGTKRGFFLAWLLKSFLLPLANDFINEVLNEIVRQQLDKRLKPVLVLKSWDSL